MLLQDSNGSGGRMRASGSSPKAGSPQRRQCVAIVPSTWVRHMQGLLLTTTASQRELQVLKYRGYQDNSPFRFGNLTLSQFLSNQHGKHKVRCKSPCITQVLLEGDGALVYFLNRPKQPSYMTMVKILLYRGHLLPIKFIAHLV